jgi:hypothetical protein
MVQLYRLTTTSWTEKSSKLSTRIWRPHRNGTYFTVWRHRISNPGEARAFQDQDGNILPQGTVVAMKRVIPRLNPITGEVDFDNSKQPRASSIEVQALSARAAKTSKHHPNALPELGD